MTSSQMHERYTILLEHNTRLYNERHLQNGVISDEKLYEAKSSWNRP